MYKCKKISEKRTKRENNVRFPKRFNARAITLFKTPPPEA